MHGAYPSGLNSRRLSSDHEFVCVGNDDGIHWWVLYGAGLPKNVTMDFTPKAPGVGKLECGIAPGKVLFLKDDKSVANTWSKLIATPDFTMEAQSKHSAFNDINGLYIDESLFEAGSFKGLRVIADRFGKSVR